MPEPTESDERVPAPTTADPDVRPGRWTNAGGRGNGHTRRAATRRVQLAQAADRPWVAAALSALAGMGAVAGRLAVAAHGTIGTFVVAGSTYARAGEVPNGIPVVPGNGYDGQFYYRMALDPLDMARTAYGITLDSVDRLSRIGYPLLAWLTAGGVRAAVPWTLVAVNVAGLAALACAGAALARSGGRHALTGVLMAAYPGFLWTLARDTTEIVAAAFLVGGLAALHRRRSLMAGLLLAGSAITRETALATVGAVFVAWLAGRVESARRNRDSHRERPAWLGPVDVRAVSWLVPVAAFAAVQAVVGARIGAFPLGSSGQHNLGLPFGGIVRGLAHYATGLPSTASLLWFGELGVLAVVVALAAGVARHAGAPLHERIAWAALIVLAVFLAPGIWLGDVGFRSLDPLYLLSMVMLLGSSRRLRVPAALVAGAWIVVAVELCLFV